MPNLTHVNARLGQPQHGQSGRAKSRWRAHKSLIDCTTFILWATSRVHGCSADMTDDRVRLVETIWRTEWGTWFHGRASMDPRKVGSHPCARFGKCLLWGTTIVFMINKWPNRYLRSIVRAKNRHSGSWCHIDVVSRQRDDHFALTVGKEQFFCWCLYFVYPFVHSNEACQTKITVSMHRRMQLEINFFFMMSSGLGFSLSKHISRPSSRFSWPIFELRMRSGCPILLARILETVRMSQP